MVSHRVIVEPQELSVEFFSLVLLIPLVSIEDQQFSDEILSLAPWNITKDETVIFVVLLRNHQRLPLLLLLGIIVFLLLAKFLSQRIDLV